MKKLPVELILQNMKSSIECPYPRPIENGRLVIVNGSNTYGTVVKYHCKPKFKRFGSFLRQCMGNGIWSESEPSCNVLDEELQTVPLIIGLSVGVVVLFIILGLIFCIRIRRAMPSTEKGRSRQVKNDQWTRL